VAGPPGDALASLGVRHAACTRMLLACLVSAGGLACRSSQEVVVYTSVDQVFSEPIFREFKRDSGIEVRAVFDTEETKSTGVLNRLVAEAESPQADVFWPGDPVRPFLLIRRGLVEPYSPPNAREIPQAFRASDGAWTGFAARARALLVNTERVRREEMPSSLRDLADSRWRGQTAIANPLYGTTTMHIAALFSLWGDDAARAFLESLRRNEVKVASSNGEVKRLVVSGEIAFGLTDTDDAHEAIAAHAPVAIVYPDQQGDGTLVMPTVAVIIRGGPNAEAARKLVDFLVSPGVEREMAEAAAHMPLRASVPVPPNVSRVGDIRSMPVDYAGLAAVIDRIQPWLREWVGLE
jgi:iron(III) transport system substrate-binding protein